MINTGFSLERHLIGNAIDAQGTIVDDARLPRVRVVLGWVFERYFTSREKSMGLPICRLIIESLLIQARNPA